MFTAALITQKQAAEPEIDLRVFDSTFSALPINEPQGGEFFE